MAKDDKPEEVPHVRGEPRPDFSKNPTQKLPKGLQKIVDDEDTLFEQMYDGTSVTTLYSQ
jgi:hypothetical protein